MYCFVLVYCIMIIAQTGSPQYFQMSSKDRAIRVEKALNLNPNSFGSKGSGYLPPCNLYIGTVFTFFPCFFQVRPDPVWKAAEIQRHL